jgi:hypothetical protein
MVSHTRQIWEVGYWVKVGFLTLQITGKVPTPGDYAPDAYLLKSAKGIRYRFVPHKGLTLED